MLDTVLFKELTFTILNVLYKFLNDVTITHSGDVFLCCYRSGEGCVQTVYVADCHDQMIAIKFWKGLAVSSHSTCIL